MILVIQEQSKYHREVIVSRRRDTLTYGLGGFEGGQVLIGSQYQSLTEFSFLYKDLGVQQGKKRSQVLSSP